MDQLLSQMPLPSHHFWLMTFLKSLRELLDAGNIQVPDSMHSMPTARMLRLIDMFKKKCNTP